MTNLTSSPVFYATTGGTADFNVGVAVPPYLLPAAAGVVNGITYGYSAYADDGIQWEQGQSIYNNGVAARTTILSNSLGTADPINFRLPPQVTLTNIAPLFSATIPGKVPPSGGGTTNFLRADGTWAPSGAGAGVASFNSRTGAVVPANTDYSFGQLSGSANASQMSLFSSSVAGAVGASGGGTTNFLRADGSWTSPGGSVTSFNTRTGAVTLVTGDMPVVNASANGAAPASGGDITTYLRADGTWTRPGFISVIDKGTVGSGTVTFDVSASSQQKLTCSGGLTVAFSNWPASGIYAEIELQLVNGVGVTWPTINWLKGDGTNNTTFATMGVTLATSGINWIVIWSEDGGTTLWGRAA